MMPGRWRPGYAVAIGAGIAVAVVYFLFDPLESPYMPQCLFKRLTGLSCPGCGSQRVLHALLHGDLAAAFRANALLVVSIPAIAWLAWLETRRLRRPELYMRVYSVATIVTVGVILLLWWVLRNIFGI